jgi:hypothetical protein
MPSWLGKGVERGRLDIEWGRGITLNSLPYSKLLIPVGVS